MPKTDDGFGGEMPPLEKIPDGGMLSVSVVPGNVVIIGVKRGGAIVQAPIFIKMNLWQAFSIFAGFIAAFSGAQVQTLEKQSGHFTKVM